jgi:hypothetical protein
MIWGWDEVVSAVRATLLARCRARFAGVEAGIEELYPGEWKKAVRYRRRSRVVWKESVPGSRLGSLCVAWCTRYGFSGILSGG